MEPNIDRSVWAAIAVIVFMVVGYLARERMFDATKEVFSQFSQIFITKEDNSQNQETSGSIVKQTGVALAYTETTYSQASRQALINALATNDDTQIQNAILNLRLKVHNSTLTQIDNSFEYEAGYNGLAHGSVNQPIWNSLNSAKDLGINSYYPVVHEQFAALKTAVGNNSTSLFMIQDGTLPSDDYITIRRNELFKNGVTDLSAFDNLVNNMKQKHQQGEAVGWKNGATSYNRSYVEYDNYYYSQIVGKSQ